MLPSNHPLLLDRPVQMHDLAPEIHRQRLVVEGLIDHHIDAAEIRTYLWQLSEVCEMRILQEPVTHQSPLYGWAGWVHWEASGAHFYAWDKPVQFFSVDLYTCTAFDDRSVLDFTARFFETDRVIGRPF